ncbi:MAG TPA: 30S ribosomal protein S6 [Longimicrobiales bacterium]|nr:30S ribosomal protein S6 [Longimicrobiales bacterium]
MVRDYEVVYIFDSALPEERVNEKLERYHELLTSDGGEVTAVDQWGRRQLAYPIAKKTNGYYVIVQARAETDALPEFERRLKLDEELLRYLVVLHEGEPTAPMSIATREPRGEDDEDEEEE